MEKSRLAIFGLAAVLVIAASVALLQSNNATARKASQTTYRIQETKMSTAAPVAHTGNLPHAVVFALPLLEDGKIYTGERRSQKASP
jgi:hypothetical protein